MFFYSSPAFLTCAGLFVGALLTPTLTLAQQPAVRWIPFQLDNQLALELPTPPRQITEAQGATLPAESYVAQSPRAPQVFWVLVRKELPATGPLPDQDISYTGMVQAALTQWQAEGLHQTSFRVGALEGLSLDFRVRKPQAGAPVSGTLWVLRVNRTVYVAQWLTTQSSLDAESVAQKQRFLASWTLTQLPAGPLSPADFEPFHVGQFRAVDPAASGPTLITRTDTAQTEVNTALGLRIVYGLKWNKLGYEMRQRSSTSSYADLMQPKVIQVRITAVQGMTYWYRATIDGLISTGRIQREK
ncbi:MAG: hypothetical protein ACRYG7_05540 [Janthinobacterium lividum]